MRAWLWSAGFGTLIGVGTFTAATFSGCSAGSEDSTSGTNGSGGSGATGSTFSGIPDAADDGLDPDAACAKFSAEGKQEPAAMLLVLDMSASMTKNNKWGTAQLAVVSAMDQDAFDNMAVGLTIFPNAVADPPACFCTAVAGTADITQCKALLTMFGYPPGVSCGAPTLPVVPMALAGMEKSNGASGVRKDIYGFLATHNPLSNVDDGSPIYASLNGAFAALKAYPGVSKRFAVLLTDGAASCASVSSPTRPGYTDSACPDWEYPATMNQLITDARNDATAPINTFVVGLPGSNTVGNGMGNGTVDGYAVPDYSVLLALSTYATSGSPDTLDPTCEKDLTFSESGVAPTKPCHIDLSSGAFDAAKLADAIASIRGKALGCVYELPEPPQGETIDPTRVNVQTSGESPSTLPKRADMSDACTTDGCWDYNAEGKIELIGRACDDIKNGETTKVEIFVGCATIVK